LPQSRSAGEFEEESYLIGFRGTAISLYPLSCSRVNGLKTKQKILRYGGLCGFGRLYYFRFSWSSVRVTCTEPYSKVFSAFRTTCFRRLNWKMWQHCIAVTARDRLRTAIKRQLKAMERAVPRSYY